MGLFDMFRNSGEDSGRNDAPESLLDCPLFGATFRTVEELYRAFDNPELARDDQMILLPSTDIRELAHRSYVLSSWEIFDLGGGLYPHIRFYAWGDAPINYGEFMDALYRKGEENGWDSLYYIRFDYAEGDANAVPKHPVVEQNANGDPHCFAVSSETGEWKNVPGSLRGIGGAAGI